MIYKFNHSDIAKSILWYHLDERLVFSKLQIGFVYHKFMSIFDNTKLAK